jgi:hypothetical protein
MAKGDIPSQNFLASFKEWLRGREGYYIADLAKQYWDEEIERRIYNGEMRREPWRQVEDGFLVGLLDAARYRVRG